MYTHIYIEIYILIYFLTWGTVHCGQHSMKAPVFTAHSNKEQENLIKATTGKATVNQTSLTLLGGVVAPENHTQKLKARDRLIGNAKPLQGGEGEEGPGETTSRDSKGQKKLTRKVVL